MKAQARSIEEAKAECIKAIKKNEDLEGFDGTEQRLLYIYAIEDLILTSYTEYRFARAISEFARRNNLLSDAFDETA